MKQTNNALKFLLAQYRSILKQATLASFLTAAAIVTTASMSTVANASSQDIEFDDSAWNSASGDITLTGEQYEQDKNPANTYTKINVTTAPSSDNTNITKLNITSGSANTITGVAASASKATLDIAATGNASDTKLTIDGSSTAASLTVKEVNLTKGTLELKGGTSSGSLSAGTITLGKTGASDRDAVVTLGNKAVFGKTLAAGKLAEQTSLNIKAGTAITASSGSGFTQTINAAVLTMDDGKLTADSDSNGSGAALTVNLVSGSITGGDVEAKSGSSVTFSFADANTSITDANDAEVERTLSITGKDALQGKGTVKFSGAGSVTLDAAAVKAAGTAGEETSITFSGSTWSSALENVTATAAKSKIDVTKSTIKLSDTTSVDLAGLTFDSTAAANKIKADNTTTVEGTNLTVSKKLGAKIKVKASETITLGSADYDNSGFSSGLTSTEAKSYVYQLQDSATPFLVDFEHKYNATKEITNPYDAEDKNKYAVADSGSITDDLNISGASAKLSIIGGHYTDSHDITLNSGSLIIGSGSSGVDASLTLTGKLTLKNTQDDTITIAGNGNRKFKAPGNQDLSSTALLDLTGSTLDIQNSTDKFTTIKVNSNGELKITGSQLGDILNIASARANSGAGILLSGGTLTIDGAVAGYQNQGLAVDKIASGSKSNGETDKVLISGAGGTIQANSFWLTADSTSKNLNLGASGSLIADTFTLDQEADATATATGKDAFTIKSGVLTVGSSLTSNNAGNGNKIVLGDGSSSGATVNLGSITKNTDSYGYGLKTYTTSDATGTVDVDLQLNGKDNSDRSKLNVAYGNWTAKNIELTKAATLTIGSTENYQDAEGDTLDFITDQTSLTAGTITVASGTVTNKVELKSDAKLTTTKFAMSGGEVTVGNSAAFATTDFTMASGSVSLSDDATFNATTFAMTNGKIEVSGSLTIAGKYTAASTGDAGATPASYGINIGSTADITATGRNATITLGDAATQAITVSGDTVKVYEANGTKVISNVLKLKEYATLQLSFADGTTLSDAALQELRKALFVNDAANGGTDASGSALKDGYIDIGKASIQGLTPNADGVIEYSAIAKYNDLTSSIKDITSDAQKHATANVTAEQVAAGNVSANVGNIQVADGTTAITLGDSVLSDSQGAKGQGNFIFNTSTPTSPIAQTTIAKGAHVVLENGGKLNNVNLTQGSDTAQTELTIKSSGDAVTSLAKLTAGENTVVAIAGKTTVTNGVNAAKLLVDDSLETTKGVYLTGDLASTGISKNDDTWRDTSNWVKTGAITAKELSVSGDTLYAGNLTITGTATFGDSSAGQDHVTLLAGNNRLTEVTLNTGDTYFGGTTTATTITAKGNIEVSQGGSLQATTINMSNGKELVVGADVEEANGTTYPSSNGYLTVDYLKLNGSTLFADPEYGQGATIVAINKFGVDSSNTLTAGNEAGILDGDAVVLRNSVLAAGVADDAESKATAIEQVKSAFDQFFDQNTGSLANSADGDIGAIFYAAKALDIAADSKIVVADALSYTDYQKAVAATSTDEFKTILSTTGNVGYIGAHSALAVSEEAAVNAKDNNGAARPAFDFATQNASLYVVDGAKVLLIGPGYTSQDEIYLFDDADNDGITLNSADNKGSLQVTTLNGLLQFSLAADGTTKYTGNKLKLNRDAVPTAFTQASEPVKYTLISVVANDADWENSDKADHKVERLHNGVAANIKFDGTDYTKANGTKLTDKEASKYFAQEVTDADGKTTYVVYNRPDNYFLDNVVNSINSHDGAAAETVARLGVYGGATQTALQASANTSSAISGRFGVGAAQSSLTYADNGEGTGLWVTPIYQKQDSDGFAAEGLDYGADINLYGVALGGDYTLANGLRIGAMFNVGSGDADGNGAAENVSNDFNYYGFGLYAGFSMNQFSVVGDLTYTVVDNDVEANTSFEKVTTSFDSKTFSIGVTGQYNLNLSGFDVAPHVGLRYTSIDLEDYEIKGSDVIAGYDSSRINVFSIPVGVSFSKDFTSADWSIKPTLDITLTGNFGDDENEGTLYWNGIENLYTELTSEVVDNFTYGATLGVAAQNGNLSFGLGVNYTGSTNTDAFGVTANARFVF